MPYGQHFMTHYLLQGLGKFTAQGSFYFDQFDENQLRRRGLILDGRRSGLVLGPLHTEGGILVLRRSNQGLEVVGEMEGWEYILSADALEEHRNELERLNHSINSDSDTLPELHVPKHCPIVDCRQQLGAMLEVDTRSQFIINRAATSLHLLRLVEIDRPFEAQCVVENWNKI